MRCWLSLVILLVLPVVYWLGPPPSGTPFGKFYVKVLDCSSQQPIAGASVNLDNPGHRASSVTNMTGYAEIQGYAWFYTYYITAKRARDLALQSITNPLLGTVLVIFIARVLTKEE